MTSLILENGHSREPGSGSTGGDIVPEVSPAVIRLDVEYLELSDKRARVVSKGGTTDWVHWQTGTALCCPGYSRPGRGGKNAAAVLIARDDPPGTY